MFNNIIPASWDTATIYKEAQSPPAWLYQILGCPFLAFPPPHPPPPPSSLPPPDQSAGPVQPQKGRHQQRGKPMSLCPCVTVSPCHCITVSLCLAVAVALLLVSSVSMS